MADWAVSTGPDEFSLTVLSWPMTSKYEGGLSAGPPSSWGTALYTGGFVIVSSVAIFARNFFSLNEIRQDYSLKDNIFDSF